MRYCKRCMLLAPMLMLGLACILYVPVYPGYEGDIKLHGVLAFLKMGQTMAYIVEMTGMETFFNLSRAQLAMIAAVEPYFITDDVQTEDTVFEGVAVRIYRPVNSTTALPGVVYYHGGGWVLGSIAFYDFVVRNLATKVGVVFVSVEYRLAPENKFPVPMEDCLKATKYFINNAAEYGVRPERIALAGDSSGGNLAAAVHLKLATMGDVTKPYLQVLICPALQPFDMLTPSYQAYSDDRIMSKSVMVDFWASYAQGHLENTLLYHDNNHVDPTVFKQLANTYLAHDILPETLIDEEYEWINPPQEESQIWHELESSFLNASFSPILADNLSVIPSAYVVTCEHDVLRDDGFFYVKRLQQAGVNVLHHHLDKGFHCFFYLHWLHIPQVDEMMAKIVDTMVSFIKNDHI